MNLFDTYPTATDAELRVLHDRLADTADAEGILDIAYRTLDTPVGTLLLAATPAGLVRVAYDSEGHDDVLQALATRISPRILNAPKRLDAAAHEIDEYFAGRRHTFDLPLDFSPGAGFPPRGAHPLARHRLWPHGELCRRGRRGGKPEGGARGRHGLRAQPAAGRRPVPPRRAFGRIRRRLPRRPGGEAPSSRPGGGVTTAARRVGDADWDAITADVNEYGCALTPQLVTAREAATLAALYDCDEHFRSTVNMGRHRFGEGQYRYFARPFPEPIDELKQALYPRLLPIARDWYAKLGRPAPWPDTLDEWLDMCHAAGQTKSTPILLKYGEKDWNALHRDLYGDLVFPLQVVINLSNPGVDHTGGEFLLLEQRPRAQSRGTAILVPQGHGLVFTTRDRPVESKRGWSAAPVRHGVSAVRSGQRFTLGLIFHDAA